LFNILFLIIILVPLILSEILAVNDQQLATDTLTLRYTPTPQTASRFIKYRFQLAEAHQTQTQSTVYQSFATTTLDPGSGIAPTSSTGTAASVLIAEKWASDNEWKVTWHSLVPGRLYDITVWTVSAYGVLSQPLRRQDRLCKLSMNKIT
jgi:cadherin 5 type 2 (VE-cadherin)